jgi:hypothetical protein
MIGVFADNQKITRHESGLHANALDENQPVPIM